MREWWIAGVVLILFAGCGGIESTTRYKTAKTNGKYYDIKECEKEMALANDIDEGERIDMIIVYKTKRTMELYRDGKKVETLPVSLGRNSGGGDKVMAGDFKTPEGQYWIRRKLCSQKYYRSLCISYPNANDVQQAKAKGLSPGGDITIHAQPTWNTSGKGNKHTLANNWTQGCVAVTNESMEKLWYAVREGVPIVIKK
jgi:murein L,D-transpeptidase YafK